MEDKWLPSTVPARAPSRGLGFSSYKGVGFLVFGFEILGLVGFIDASGVQGGHQGSLLKALGF